MPNLPLSPKIHEADYENNRDEKLNNVFYFTTGIWHKFL